MNNVLITTYFLDNLCFSSTEIDDMLRKSTNLLLTRTLSSCLQNLIKKPHIGLTEVVLMQWLNLSAKPSSKITYAFLSVVFCS